MKTIQFTGAEHKIENLHLALGISDNDMPDSLWFIFSKYTLTLF